MVSDGPRRSWDPGMSGCIFMTILGDFPEEATWRVPKGVGLREE